MQTIDLKLLTTINQIVDDLSKPSVHFLVHGAYSLDDETNWICGPILLKHGLVDFYEFYPSGIHCLVHVSKFESDENLLLRIPYEKIWKISRFYSLDFTDEQVLYMKAPNLP
ncbi:MAG: hypothetical protein BGO21_22110 [Dyadobacter sp. 50-39]|nr:MAG: hypothetical protein BGO21_22110 [Dyadobacter sp. 50-39]